MGGWSNATGKAGAGKGNFLGNQRTPAPTPWVPGARKQEPNRLSANSNAMMAKFLAGPIKFMQTQQVVPTSNSSLGHALASHDVVDRFMSNAGTVLPADQQRVQLLHSGRGSATPTSKQAEAARR